MSDATLPVIATVTVRADGSAVVKGDRIAADRERIIEGLEKAIDWLRSHGPSN